MTKRTGTANMIPAIPPEDYSGSIADWIMALVSRGLMKEGDDYTSLYIPEEVYVEILGECERND